MFKDLKEDMKNILTKSTKIQRNSQGRDENSSRHESRDGVAKAKPNRDKTGNENLRN